MRDCSASCNARLLINTVLLRACLPLFIAREDLGTPKRSAMKLITASLALFSTGGAVTQILKALPCIPATLFFEARGWTYTRRAITLFCRQLRHFIQNKSGSYVLFFPRFFFATGIMFFKGENYFRFGSVLDKILFEK